MATQVKKSSNAAVQKGVARADGKLVITADDHVEFTPFNTQFGLGPYRFSKTAVTDVHTTTVKGGGFLPISHDAIEVALVTGERFEFIVADPATWITMLQ